MKTKLLHSESKHELFREIFCVGFKDAVKTSLGIFKIMLPVLLLMAIINYIGIVNRLFD